MKEQSCTGSNNDKAAVETPSTTHLKVVSRLPPILLQAMDHIGQRSYSQALEGSIIYKFVETYKTVLQRVCTLAAHDGLSTETTSRPSISACAKGEQPTRGERSGSATIPFKQPEIILSLCDLAVAMTTALNPTKPAHARMLEGCLSLLMTKIGSGLRTAIFGIRNNHATNNETRDPERGLEEADRMLEAQGPYLIYILERTPTKLISDQSPQQTPSSALLRLAKEKLQNTMLNAVFPHSTLGLMKHSLEPPGEPPADLQQFLDVEAGEARDWYKNEVWRLVGWDALDDHLRMAT